MINLNANLKDWIKFGWMDESHLTNLKKQGIILEDEYYDVLSSIEDETSEDLLQKVVVTISSIIN
ncbi:MAG: hypothetical protein IKT40_06150 [Bacilli bacterium]|nr:hypothetical protein [Bacilli bacterium]